MASIMQLVNCCRHCQVDLRQQLTSRMMLAMTLSHSCLTSDKDLPELQAASYVCPLKCCKLQTLSDKYWR
jgi:hypothetical protein